MCTDQSAFKTFGYSSYDADDKEVEDSDAEEEVNGNDDESEEEGNIIWGCMLWSYFYVLYVASDASSDDDDELDSSMGLNAVYSENIEDFSDEGDYEAGEEEEDEDGIDEEEEELELGEDESPAPEGKWNFLLYIFINFVKHTLQSWMEV